MRNRIVESVLTALLLAILGAAWQTYNEVKLLRFEMNQLSKDLADLRKDSDWALSELSDAVQRQGKR